LPTEGGLEMREGFGLVEDRPDGRREERERVVYSLFEDLIG
jgi:hypothetical protein